MMADGKWIGFDVTDPAAVLPYVGGLGLLGLPLFYGQDLMRLWSGILLVSLLFFAGLEDGLTGYISDGWSLAIAAGGALHWLAWGTGTDLFGALGVWLCFGGLCWMGRSVMGEGDVWLGSAIALWLPGEMVLLFLWLAFVLGGAAAACRVWKGRRARQEGMAFGPFLALGGGMAYVFGETLWAQYMALF